MFQDFLNRGEIPNMLLAGPPGIGKTTVAKALCNQLGVDYYVINGSDEGRFLDTVRNNAKNFASTVSLQATSNTKSSSLMRRITRPMMYNSAYGRLLRSLLVTADSSLPATTKTKSSNHFIPVAQWLNSESKEKNEQELPTVSSLDFEKSSTEKEFSTKPKYSLNSSTSTSQTGEESSTSVNDTPWVVRLIRAFLRRSGTSQ